MIMLWHACDSRLGGGGRLMYLVQPVAREGQNQNSPKSLRIRYSLPIRIYHQNVRRTASGCLRSPPNKKSLTISDQMAHNRVRPRRFSPLGRQQAFHWEAGVNPSHTAEAPAGVAQLNKLPRQFLCQLTEPAKCPSSRKSWPGSWPSSRL